MALMNDDNYLSIVQDDWQGLSFVLPYSKHSTPSLAAGETPKLQEFALNQGALDAAFDEATTRDSGRCMQKRGLCLARLGSS